MNTIQHFQDKDSGFCPECGIGLNNDEIRIKFCQNCHCNWNEEELN